MQNEAMEQKPKSLTKPWLIPSLMSKSTIIQLMESPTKLKLLGLIMGTRTLSGAKLKRKPRPTIRPLLPTSRVPNDQYQTEANESNEGFLLKTWSSPEMILSVSEMSL